MQDARAKLIYISSHIDGTSRAAVGCTYETAPKRGQTEYFNYSPWWRYMGQRKCRPEETTFDKKVKLQKYTNLHLKQAHKSSNRWMLEAVQWGTDDGTTMYYLPNLTPGRTLSRVNALLQIQLHSFSQRAAPRTAKFDAIIPRAAAVNPTFKMECWYDWKARRA